MRCATAGAGDAGRRQAFAAMGDQLARAIPALTLVYADDGGRRPEADYEALIARAEPIA